MPVKQAASILSTYAADTSGVCSALYELGGMTVMHDASGCNSTYTTHDEPRWYDCDSMVYISGLTEIDAILGSDEKLIREITETAEKLSPAFIAVAGTPIPMITGTDFPAIAAEVENRTGIPSFGFPTNGMYSYLRGAGMAFQTLAERMVDGTAVKTREPSVNLLGLTPLDFSVNGSAESIRRKLEAGGFRVVGSWAMGSSLAELRQAGRAWANLVVSASGLSAAKTLREKFHTPFVAGAPFGDRFSGKILADLNQAVRTGRSGISYAAPPTYGEPEIAVVGESVAAGSLAWAVAACTGKTARAVCPLETDPELLPPGGAELSGEEELAGFLRPYRIIVADPLYRPVCPKGCRFVPLPHEAFSGRIFRKEIPDLAADFDGFFRKFFERGFA